MFHSAILIHFDVDIFQMEVLDFRNQGGLGPNTP